MPVPESSIPPWLLSDIGPLLDHLPDGIYILDHTGGLIYANHTFLRMLGRDPAEGMPRHVSEWNAQWDADQLPARVAARIVHKLPFLTQHRRHDGNCYDAAIRVSTITHDGQTYLFCSVRDVTEQRQIEMALRASEEQYRLLVTDLKEVVFRTDAEGRWSFLNPAWHEMTGFAVAESLGQIFLDYVYPDDRQGNLDLFQTLMEHQQDHARHEVRYLHRDGGFRWVKVWARLILDAQGIAVGTAGTLTDITEGYRAEVTLRDGSQGYSSWALRAISVKIV